MDRPFASLRHPDQKPGSWGVVPDSLTRLRDRYSWPWRLAFPVGQVHDPLGFAPLSPSRSRISAISSCSAFCWLFGTPARTWPGLLCHFTCPARDALLPGLYPRIPGVTFGQSGRAPHRFLSTASACAPHRSNCQPQTSLRARPSGLVEQPLRSKARGGIDLGRPSPARQSVPRDRLSSLAKSIPKQRRVLGGGSPAI